MDKPKDDASPKRIWDSVKEGRDAYQGAWGEGDDNPAVASLLSENVGPYGELLASSYPHLTHKKGNRAAHVTSSRLVDDRDPNYLIHQRYHQDNELGSVPMHDRFFAVHRQTGEVTTATARLVASTKQVHVPRKLCVPERDQPLGSVEDIKSNFVCAIGTVIDTKHPPLSPRSSRRTGNQ